MQTQTPLARPAPHEARQHSHGEPAMLTALSLRDFQSVDRQRIEHMSPTERTAAAYAMISTSDLLSFAAQCNAIDDARNMAPTAAADYIQPYDIDEDDHPEIPQY